MESNTGQVMNLSSLYQRLGGLKDEQKGKGISLDKKLRNESPNENERSEARRQLWLRVAAIFLVIVFLASECTTLLLME